MEQKLQDPKTKSPDTATTTPQERATSTTVPIGKSIGERIFNWIVYGGIAAVGTFFITPFLAYKQQHGGGAQLYQKAISGLQKIGFSEKHSSVIAETTSLMHGGNVMVAFVAIFERFKVPIVNLFNRALGDKTDPATIADKPPQTVWSLVKARATAWLVVAGALTSAKWMFSSTFDLIQNKCGELLCALKNQPIERAGNPTKDYLTGRLFAQDAFATAAAATILYIGGHYFAKKAAEKKATQPAHPKHSGSVFADAIDPADIKPLPREAANEPSFTVSKVERKDALAPETQPKVAVG